MSDSSKLIGRWESRGGKHWVELHWSHTGYSYTGNNCGGSLGSIFQSAWTQLISKINSGYFLPDSTKTRMKRTFWLESSREKVSR